MVDENSAPEHKGEGEPGHHCPHCDEIADLKTATAELAQGLQAEASGDHVDAEESALDALDMLLGD
jgi:hypothetical protein